MFGEASVSDIGEVPEDGVPYAAQKAYSSADSDLADPPDPRMQRVSAEARVSAKRRDDDSVLDDLYQRGSAKIHLPSGDGFEAVLINTAGGLTGDDHIQFSVAAGGGTSVTATTQTAERIYRSTGNNARVENRLTLAPGSRLDWLPQETIVFDRGRLQRTLSVDMAEGATLLAVESFVFGREAMGERVIRGFVADQWRVRRGKRLAYADAFRIEGAVAETLDATAALGGARACATLLYAAPDARDLLDPLREAVQDFDAGASFWNGLIAARIVAMNAATLRAGLTQALSILRPQPLPRVWAT